jgi:hypothetical protein
MNYEDARDSAVQSLSHLTVFRLSKMADCGEPDSATSEGAALLKHVRDGVVEFVDSLDVVAIERLASDPNDVGWLDYSGELHQIAADAPDVYTHTFWKEFVDLAAFNEEPEITDGTVEDIARNAVYHIADRLVWALCTEAGETIAELADDEDDDA